MRNVNVGQVKEAVIIVDFFYEEGDAGKFTPSVKNIFVENLSSEKSEYALLMKGYKRSPVINIELKNCIFNNVEKENILENVEKLKLSDVIINGKEISSAGN
jgi:hypothetical protein